MIVMGIKSVWHDCGAAIIADDGDEEEPPKKTQKAFYDSLLNKSIHVAENRLMFVSAAHTEEQITIIINEFSNTLLEFSKERLL